MSFLDEVEELCTTSRFKPQAKAVIAIVGIALVIAIALIVHMVGSTGDSASHVEVQTTGAQAQPAHGDSQQDASTSAQATDIQTIKVYVTGAVAHPGVYEVARGARVGDVVDQAGGFTKKADAQSTNLARTVEDGEQIDILTKAEAKVRTQGEEVGGQTSSSQGAALGSGSSSSSGSSSTAQTTSQGKVNINTADETQLQALDGVGPATASKIIESRTNEGAFKKPEDLKRVSGIGDKKYAAIADKICV